jgi:predicted nucleic acid-binding protein
MHNHFESTPMNDADAPYMLDTNVFNDVLDGKISPMALTGHRLLVIGVQLAELNATRNSARRADLRAVFEEISPSNERAASFAWGIEGAGWDEAYWNDGSGNFQRIFARLAELDFQKKKDRGDLNKMRDILIAETAIKNHAVLVTRDCNLRRVVSEFGGRAIERLP